MVQIILHSAVTGPLRYDSGMSAQRSLRKAAALRMTSPTRACRLTMTTPTLQQLAAKADAYVRAVEAREREVAEAAEALSQDAAVQAAFRQGQQHERDRVLALITAQQDQLARGGINALVLGTLRRQVLEAQP